MDSYFILSIKPNLNIDDAVNFLNKITENGEKTFKNFYAALPYSILKEASSKFSNSGILFGSPYLNDVTQDSFTGPIAVELLKNAGAQFVLIGAEEEHVKEKIEAAKPLQTIFRIGETYEEKMDGKSLEVLKEQLERFGEISPNQIVIYQIPFRSFQDYLPSKEEIEKAYELCQHISDNNSNISWAIELPIDLAGFSEGIEQYPFKGYYFVKAGIFPHAIHSEALELFKVHS